MTSFPAIFVSSLSIEGATNTPTESLRATYPGFQSIPAPPLNGYVPGFDDVDALLDEADAGLLGVFGQGEQVAAAQASRPAFQDDIWNMGDLWFELVHVIPRSFAFGNILSTQVRAIEVFNADRRLTHTLDSFTNNAGTGVSIIDLPSLPFVLNSLAGLDLTLQVTADGPPTIDGTIDFEFDLYTTLVPITGTRIVFFPYRPQSPVQEFLRFGVQVIEPIAGNEQRIKIRKSPRQEFIFRVRADDVEREAIQNLLYDWQGRIFGVPVWMEPSYLTSPVVASAITLPVDDTSYGDFRVGGLAIVFTDRKIFDAHEIVSVAPTSIEIISPLENGYPVGTLVMPVRVANTNAQLSGRRFRTRVADIEVPFRVLDNDVDLSDTSAFSSLNGKVFFDDFNKVRGATTPESFRRRLYQQDGGTGVFDQGSRWGRNKRSSVKGFSTNSRKELFELRQVLYALGGRLESFYIPTFFDNLVPTAPLVSGSPTLTITNVGYTDFVQDRKSIIRVVKTDGTTIIRNVVSSSEIDADTEQLTLDDNWPSTIPVVDVDRIEFIEIVRSASDDILIVHRNAIGHASVQMPVVEVFSE